jgi:hypothetical protein
MLLASTKNNKKAFKRFVGGRKISHICCRRIEK